MSLSWDRCTDSTEFGHRRGLAFATFPLVAMEQLVCMASRSNFLPDGASGSGGGGNNRNGEKPRVEATAAAVAASLPSPSSSPLTTAGHPSNQHSDGSTSPSPTSVPLLFFPKPGEGKLPPNDSSSSGISFDEDWRHQPTYEDLARQISLLKSIVERVPGMEKTYNTEECVQALKSTVMLHSIPDPLLRQLAPKLERLVYPAGSLIVRDGEEQESAYVIVAGQVRRWVELGGRQHLATTYCTNSIGLLLLYSDMRTSRFNAECVTDVVVYRLRRQDLDELMKRHHEVPQAIIKELTWTIRSASHGLLTPLVEQRSHNVSWSATALAATVESFYRSAINNLINQKLTGTKGSWFPQMHIQTPTRIVYISGLKHIRQSLDGIDFGANPNVMLYRSLLCLIPGLVMCPFSSLLEATNAGHSNPEPLARRWIRGYRARLVREVFFAMGINQMADYLSERWGGALTENVVLRGFVGSFAGGLISGYLSHVPHVLSAMKLMNPQKTYRELWEQLCEKSVERFQLNREFTYTFAESGGEQLSSSGTSAPPSPHGPQKLALGLRIGGPIATALFPIGVVRRSIQIAGSFLLINGITYSLRDMKLY